MAIRFSFNPDKRDEPPQLIINKPPKPVPKLSELKVFKQTDNRIKKDYEQDSLGKNKIEGILAELDTLVGLYYVKKLILEIRAYIEIQKRREKENLWCEPMVLHMVFRGNPGTGKTTVARLVARLLRELGVLDKGQVVEVERGDLVGEYIGHTAQKTREQIKKALGGVLFIDEAYALARGGEKDFGKEAIDTIVKNMEEYKNNLIIILAGYKQEMSWFLETNPGLRSRFPIHVDFPDYTISELLAIAEIMLNKRQYQLSEEAKLELENYLMQTMHTRHEHSGNARFIRNLIERAMRQQALRLVDEDTLSRNDLLIISKQDLLMALSQE